MLLFSSKVAQLIKFLFRNSSYIRSFSQNYRLVTCYQQTYCLCGNSLEISYICPFHHETAYSHFCFSEDIGILYLKCAHVPVVSILGSALGLNYDALTVCDKSRKDAAYIDTSLCYRCQ